MDNSMTDLQHWLVHGQIYSMHLFNRSDIEPVWRGHSKGDTVGEGWTTAPIHIWENGTTSTTGPDTAQQTKMYEYKRGRERERASGCSRTEWGNGRKVKPWQPLPQASGAGFAEPTRPEEQRRCHYREERERADQRRERKEERDNLKAKSGFYCLFFWMKTLLTLSSFFYTRTTLLQPAEPVATAAARVSLWRLCLQTQTNKHKNIRTVHWECYLIPWNYINDVKGVYTYVHLNLRNCHCWIWTHSDAPPTQVNIYTHKHTLKVRYACMQSYIGYFHNQLMTFMSENAAPHLHSGRRVMVFIEHCPLAQYSFVSHV